MVVTINLEQVKKGGQRQPGRFIADSERSIGHRKGRARAVLTGNWGKPRKKKPERHTCMV